MYVRGMIKKTDLEENLENLRKIFDYLDDFGDFN